MILRTVIVWIIFLIIALFNLHSAPETHKAIYSNLAIVFIWDLTPIIFDIIISPTLIGISLYSYYENKYKKLVTNYEKYLNTSQYSIKPWQISLAVSCLCYILLIIILIIYLMHDEYYNFHINFYIKAANRSLKFHILPVSIFWFYIFNNIFKSSFEELVKISTHEKIPLK